MNVFTNAVPVWVSVLFLLTAPIPLFMISSLFKQGVIKSNVNTSQARNVFWAVLIYFGVYFVYTSVMSFTGIFMVNTLPPKVFLYTAIPFLIVSVLVITNIKLFREALLNVPLEALVGVHISGLSEFSFSSPKHMVRCPRGLLTLAALAMWPRPSSAFLWCAR